MLRLLQIFLVFVLAAYAVIESHIVFIKWLFGFRQFRTTVCADGANPTNRAILGQCSTLLDFRAAVWGQGPLLQLFLAVFCGAPVVSYHRDVLIMADGGSVALDWSGDPELNPTAPTLVLLHGIAGNSQEQYIRRMVSTVTALGWVVVVYNRRGHALAEHAAASKAVRASLRDAKRSAKQQQSDVAADTILSGEPTATPRPPSAPESPGGTPADPPTPAKKTWALYCDVADMSQVVTEIRRRRPQSSGFHAVGFSAGSNCLVKYLGEAGSSCQLDAAVSVANAYDLAHGVQFLERQAPLLERMITLNLIRIFKSCESDIEAHSPRQVEPVAVKKIKTIRQLDTTVTAKLYKMTDVEAYYRDSSCISVMGRVTIPLLCLNAMDDPLIDPNLSLSGNRFAKENPNIISVLTSHGGHLGWVTGWKRQWMCRAVSDFLLAVHAAADERVVEKLSVKVDACSGLVDR